MRVSSTGTGQALIWPHGSFGLGPGATTYVMVVRDEEDAPGGRSADASPSLLPPVASFDVAERHEKLTEDVDAILDDIDDVLETNAEDFVRAFVQKGGE